MDGLMVQIDKKSSIKNNFLSYFIDFVGYKYFVFWNVDTVKLDFIINCIYKALIFKGALITICHKLLIRMI